MLFYFSGFADKCYAGVSWARGADAGSEEGHFGPRRGCRRFRATRRRFCPKTIVVDAPAAIHDDELLEGHHRHDNAAHRHEASRMARWLGLQAASENSLRFIGWAPA